MILNIIILITVVTLIALSIVVIYMTFIYRKLLYQYNDLLLKENKSEIKKNIERNAMKFVDSKIDSAISKSLDEAIELISKNAKNVTNSMKRKTIEKLEEEEIANEHVIAASFDESRQEVEKYKLQRIEEVKQKTGEILLKVAKESVIDIGKSLSKEDQENIILKAIDNAKNIFQSL